MLAKCDPQAGNRQSNNKHCRISENNSEGKTSHPRNHINQK